jgi:hypothetical protein
MMPRATEIGNAYLEAKTSENLYIVRCVQKMPGNSTPPAVVFVADHFLTAMAVMIWRRWSPNTTKLDTTKLAQRPFFSSLMGPYLIGAVVSVEFMLIRSAEYLHTDDSRGKELECSRSALAHAEVLVDLMVVIEAFLLGITRFRPGLVLVQRQRIQKTPPSVIKGLSWSTS